MTVSEDKERRKADALGALREKWCQWLANTQDQALQSSHDRHLWREVVAIVNAIPATMHPDDTLVRWMGRNYAVAAALFVRRQTDMTSTGGSLRRVLEDLKRHPDAISRQWVVEGMRAIYGETGEAIAHGEFDDLFGEGTLEADPDVVAAKIEELDAAAEKTRRYVDKALAHTDRVWRQEDAPTWNELAGAVETIERICVWCLQVVKRVADISFPRTPDPTWRHVLRKPWLPPLPCDDPLEDSS
jgi:HEPN superfamily AbiU2-like protein